MFTDKQKEKRVVYNSTKDITIKKGCEIFCV